MVEHGRRRSGDQRIGRILAAVAAVGTIIALIAAVTYLVDHLVRGPTVDAGESFTVNGTEYRVDVVRNTRSGLVVNIHTKNRQHSPHSPGQAIFELDVRAGDQKVVWDCVKLGCMGDVLQPGETRTYTFQFVVKRPADSLEFVDTTNEISGRVALIRLRPTPTSSEAAASARRHRASFTRSRSPHSSTGSTGATLAGAHPRGWFPFGVGTTRHWTMPYEAA